MSFSIGIIGLPNAGKSTLFKALTKKEVDIAPYAFCTKDPNIGIVEVPDKRLEKIAEIIKPEKLTPTVIEFVDIAGLVRGAHKGEGLGNQFLAHIRNCSAIVEVVRDFHNSKVEHIEGSIAPLRDISIIKTELILKDLETAENAIAKKNKENQALDKNILKKLELLKKIKQAISKEKSISSLVLSEEEILIIKEYQFLTAKPILFLFNYSGNRENRDGEKEIYLDIKLEQEISELSKTEFEALKIKSGLDQLILYCYNILELITFFTTAGGKETRAWTLKKDSTALQAGGCVHTDFERNFIKAEVINCQELINAGSYRESREKGLIREVSKDYIMQDGDIIEFKI